MNKTRALVLVALGLMLAVQQFLQFPGPSYWADLLQDAAHVPWFAAVTAALWWLFKRWGWTTAIAVVLALGTEGLQLFTGREASVGDLANDAAGFLISYAAISLTQTDSARLKAVSSFCLVLGIAYAVAPLGRAWLAEQYFESQFPTLLSRDWRGTQLLKPTTPIKIDNGVRVTFDTSPWPGVHLLGRPTNWHGYRAIVIRLQVTGTRPLTLAVGLKTQPDQPPSHYADMTVSPGPQTLSVAFDALNFDPQDFNVYDVYIYSYGEQHANRQITIQEVYLAL